MNYSLTIFSLLAFFIPGAVFAQDTPQVPETERFEAQVVEILEEKEVERENGSTFVQQNLKLEGLEDEWEGREVEYYGIASYEVAGQAYYKEGQRVIVTMSERVDGEQVFYVVDHVRRTGLYWLIALFVLSIIAIGTWKGLRALIALIVTFGIIMGAMLPAILQGWNPLLVSLIGAFAILLFVVYITEGFNRRSHIGVVSILISLLLTGAISIFFTYATHLTGTTQEEVMYLIGLGQAVIDFKGLLLAAILIGAVGILDDVVISQVASVEQIKEANPDLSKKEVFSRALKIGKSHLGSMVNTLFLAYAGASLPLLLLFSLNQPPFDSFSAVINNELIATEIVRTIAGSIGIALAVPISSLLASRFMKCTPKKTERPKKETKQSIEI